MLQECELNIKADGRELQPHGSIEFPCAAFHEILKGEANVPWHWHDEMEFIYVVEGSLKAGIPGKTYHLTAGEGIFINSGIMHNASGEHTTVIHSLVFHPILIMGDVTSIFARKYIIPIKSCITLDCCTWTCDTAEDRVVIEAFCKAFKACSSEKEGYEFTVREQLSRICMTIFYKFKDKFDKEESSIDLDHSRSTQMQTFIHEHYMEPITLAIIANHIHISQRECLRCFHRVQHISPMQYVIKYRILKSATILIEQPNESISSIALQCGFDSPSNFTQMFKRYFGNTPRNYREKNRV